MPVSQIIQAVAHQGGGSHAPGGTGSSGTAVYNGVPYILTPKVNGNTNIGVALPGDVISWTIDSAPSQAGHTIVWWVDAFAVPANTFVENPSYFYDSTTYPAAGSVVLDGNGSASWSLTVANPVPTHALFRLYIGDGIYAGFLTHGYIGV